MLELAISGDDRSWKKLTDLYGPIIYARCLSRGLPETDAKDVTQEIFLSVYNTLHRFQKRGPSDRFLGWILTITSRRIADFFRRQKNIVRAIGGSDAKSRILQLKASEPHHDSFEIDQFRVAVVERALNLMKSDFKDTTWKAFYMTMVEGKTTRETALALGIRTGSVRQARSRVRKRLLEELGDVF